MSPLKVVGNDAFYKQVLDALGEICPCRAYTIDAGGAITLGSWNAVAKARICSCYCGHVAGCNLLSSHYEPGSQHTAIERSVGGDFYYDDVDKVWWNPDLDAGGLNTAGNKKRPPSVGLAHELIHAIRDSQGGYIGDTDHNGEEFATVRGENQIRREMCVPQRTHYDDKEVPNYSSDLLDETDTLDCGCDSLRYRLPTFFGFVRCTVIAVLTKLIHLLKVVPILRVPPIPPTPIEPEYDMCDFDDLLPTPAPGERSPALVQRMETALASRATYAHRPHIAAIETGLAPTTDYALVEGVDLDGVYRAVLLTAAEGGGRMITNLGLRPGDSVFFVGEPGDLVEYALDASTIPDVTRSVVGLNFPDGFGGRSRAIDGTVQFISVRADGTRRCAALYAMLYEGFNATFTRPDGQDGERWDAISAVYRTWKTVLDSNPDRVRLIAPIDR